MGGAGGKAGIGRTHEGERLRNEVERVRHCARSDRVAAGRNPAAANLGSEDLKPRDWIGRSGEVGVQTVLLTEREPDRSVGGGIGDSSARNAKEQGSFDSAEIAPEFMLERRWQIFHGRTWGKSELKWESRRSSERSQRRERVSAMTLIGPGM